MDPIQAMPRIPAEWGPRIHCPVCARQGLRVVSAPGKVDRLQCPACRLSIEMEKDGQRVRLTGWPADRPLPPGVVGGAWTTLAELRAAAQPAAARAPSEVQAGTPAEDPELLAQVRNLRTLGNNHARIQAVLEQSLPDPERRKAALEIEARLERQEQSHQQRKLFAWLGAAVVLALALVVIGVSLLDRRAPADPRTAVSTLSPAAAAQASALAQITDKLHLATPVVYRYAAQPITSATDQPLCPSSAPQAAAVFGGLPTDWKAATGGWMMADTSRSATVNIPNGMTAAYLDLDNGVYLTDVNGPAQLLNVYYLVVSCPVY